MGNFIVVCIILEQFSWFLWFSWFSNNSWMIFKVILIISKWFLWFSRWFSWSLSNSYNFYDSHHSYDSHVISNHLISIFIIIIILIFLMILEWFTWFLNDSQDDFHGSQAIFMISEWFFLYLYLLLSHPLHPPTHYKCLLTCISILKIIWI